jgi:hypothetical protein
LNVASDLNYLKLIVYFDELKSDESEKLGAFNLGNIELISFANLMVRLF